MSIKKYQSIILFLLGFGIFLFTRMSFLVPTIPIAILIAPIFILRFIRTQPPRRGILLTLLGFILIINIGLWGIFDMGGEVASIIFNLIRSTILALLYFFPFMTDRLIYPKFKDKGSLATLTFPVISTALFFFLTIEGPFEGSYQMGKFLYGPVMLRQLISLFGLPASVFFTTWFVSVINYLWEYKFDWKKVKKITMVFLAVFISIFIFGTIKTFSSPKSKTVKMASVVFIPEDGKAVSIPPMLESRTPHPYEERMSTIKETTRIAASNGAKIVTFQEFTIILNDENRERFIKECQDIAIENNVYLAVNYAYYVIDGKGANTLLFIDDSGNTLLSYDKKYLLGIGDSVEKGVFKKGPEIIQSVDTPYGRIGLSICREADMAKYLVQAGRQNVDIMISPAYEWPINIAINCGYMRGIENGFSLIRATYNGISFASDFNGKILATMPFDKNETGIMYADVPTRGVKTLYPHIKDIFGWICVLGLIGLIIISIIRKIKKSINNPNFELKK